MACSPILSSRVLRATAHADGNGFVIVDELYPFVYYSVCRKAPSFAGRMIECSLLKHARLSSEA